ncbi:hypothetical protein M0R45_033779 [Rubus argutus]|uniref:F-box protein n=1 Tax=Rubus argutus TaxID=59490 RepID=A0AAW1WQ74_RUBAR
MFPKSKRGTAYIWVVSEQVVRRVVADQGEGSYGFGHSKDGDFVIVRLGCTPLISTKLMRNESFTYYLDTCVETHDKQKKDSWTRTEACLQVVSTCCLALYSCYPKNSHVPPLHIWVLHDDFWHKLLAMPSSPYNNPKEVFVPLTFYYGKEDGAINLLFHRNGEEIVISIPAEEVLSTLNLSFREVSVPSAIPSGIKMEFSSWRKFQATPLGDRIYGKKHKEQALGNKVPEEDNKKSGNKISLSFEDDES